LLYNITQARSIDMRIDLRGGNIGVTKKLLYHSKVSPAGEHMGSKAMPEHMWMYVFEPCSRSKATNNLPHSYPLNWPASV